MKKYHSVRGVLLSCRGVGLFRTVFFRLSIKVTRTDYVLIGTYILTVCWFLPAVTADTDSIASLMRI